MKQETDHEAETSAWNHKIRGDARADPSLWNRSCTPLKCTRKRGSGSWYKSLRSCCPFCREGSWHCWSPCFPWHTSSRERGRSSPKKWQPVRQAAGPVQHSVSSSFGRGYVKFGQHFCESCILWAEILSTEWEGEKEKKKKISLLKSFQFLPVCSKGQIGSFSLLTV